MYKLYVDRDVGVAIIQGAFIDAVDDDVITIGQLPDRCPHVYGVC